jgi:hypothetical protein
MMDIDDVQFPETIIQCDYLTREAIQAYFSLNVANPDQCAPGTLWDKQQKAYFQSYSSPPMGSGFKQQKDKNLREKYKTMLEGGGMAAKHLSFTPASFQFVMNPEVVAKILGIYRERELRPGTLKKIMSHWRQLARFVASKWCPKSRNATYSSDFCDKLDRWYADFVKSFDLEARTEARAGPDVHLYEVWKYATSQWLEWCQKFKVCAQQRHSFRHVATQEWCAPAG